jgi:predicted Rossmann-fold nucleotide-binding protein
MHAPQVALHPISRHIDVTAKDPDHTRVVEDFMRERGIAFTLAFSGGADDNSPALEAFHNKLLTDERLPESMHADLSQIAKASLRESTAKIVREILEPLRGYRIAVLTGGTSWGVPDVATRVAKQLGFTTIGVYPLTAKTKGNALSAELLDLSICVHPFIGESVWGDESAIFTKLLSAVVVIGGNAGTMVEVAHLLKLNEKKNLPTKWIIPVYGTGGTADKLSFFPGKPETIAKCIPSLPIRTGQLVVDFLHQMNVLNDDIYEPV